MTAAIIGVRRVVLRTYARRRRSAIVHTHALVAPAPAALLTRRGFADHGGVSSAARFDMGAPCGASSHATGARARARVEEALALRAPTPAALLNVGDVRSNPLVIVATARRIMGASSRTNPQTAACMAIEHALAFVTPTPPLLDTTRGHCLGIRRSCSGGPDY